MLALAAVAVAALIALVYREKRAPFPLLPISLLRQATIWRSDALAACHGATLVALVSFLPLYLRVARGSSASETGLLLLPLMFGIGAGSMITGRSVSRTGLTAIFPSVGLVFATLALTVFALVGRQPERMAARHVPVRDRPVHGHRHGRGPGDGAECGRPRLARLCRGLGPALALDRRRRRHRARRRRAVRVAGAERPRGGSPRSAAWSSRDRPPSRASRPTAGPFFSRRSRAPSAPPSSRLRPSPPSAWRWPGPSPRAGCEYTPVIPE